MSTSALACFASSNGAPICSAVDDAARVEGADGGVALDDVVPVLVSLLRLRWRGNPPHAALRPAVPPLRFALEDRRSESEPVINRATMRLCACLSSRNALRTGCADMSTTKLGARATSAQLVNCTRFSMLLRKYCKVHWRLL